MKPAVSVMSLHGERGQLQAGDPAFGAGFQRGDVFRREAQTHHLVEKLGGFGGGEAQVGGAQLGHLAPGAQPGQGQLRVLAGGDDQVHLRRQVLEQKGEGLVHRFGVDQVVVVQDEDEVSGHGGDLVEQGRQDRFDGRRLGGLERSQHPCSDIRPRSSAGQRRGRSESVWGRYPLRPATARRPGRCATGDPFADQRGLAKAGGGGDEGQLARAEPSFSRSIRRGRRTTFGRGGGI